MSELERETAKERERDGDAKPRVQQIIHSFRFNHSLVSSFLPPSSSSSSFTICCYCLCRFDDRLCNTPKSRSSPRYSPCAQPLAAAKLRTLGLSISSIRDKCHVTARRERAARERESDSRQEKERERESDRLSNRYATL